MALSLAAISSALGDLASVPWLEEAFLIASIGVAVILTHKFGIASVRRPAKRLKLACEDESEEEEQEDEGPSCRPSRAQPRAAWRAREPERRDAGVGRVPRSSAEMPGVTDRRFVGRIVSYKEEEGYGFISCPELYPRFGRDVFLHRLQVGDFRVDDRVSFGVFLNKNGQPQAKELEERQPVSEPALQQWGAWSPCAEPFEPFQPFEPVAKRQPLNPHAKPFQTQADLQDYSSTAEPEATWKQQPSSRKEWSDKKHYWTPSGPSDQDPKAGAKRWVPKASSQLAR